MPCFKEIIEKYNGSIRWVQNLRGMPETVELLVKPLQEAGLNDFEMKGSGGQSFCIAPKDCNDYVFRVTKERDTRPIDSPFFFQSGYQNEIQVYPDDEDDKIRLEMLLHGTLGALTEDQKKFLLNEMVAAGWKKELLDRNSALWKDVLLLSTRSKNSRIKTVPMITDPSVREWAAYMMPETPNRCSDNYISLQEQADKFNMIRERDQRAKILIPEPVIFSTTHITTSHHTTAKPPL